MGPPKILGADANWEVGFLPSASFEHIFRGNRLMYFSQNMRTLGKKSFLHIKMFWRDFPSLFILLSTGICHTHTVHILWRRKRNKNKNAFSLPSFPGGYVLFFTTTDSQLFPAIIIAIPPFFRSSWLANYLGGRTNARVTKGENSTNVSFSPKQKVRKIERKP